MSKEAIGLGVLYKNLIGRLKELIISPQSEWKIVMEERKTTNDVLSSFSLPLIGFYTAAVFVGYLLSHQELDFQAALKSAAFTFSGFFFGLYLSYYSLFKAFNAFNLSIDKEQVFQLVAFSSCVMYLTGSVIALIPEAIIIGSILNLYVAYLVWLALGHVNNVTKENRVWLTALSSIVILLIPVLIDRLFIFISNLTV
ncbi:Yip1 family protein [Carboxylicivirga sp. M1479]|uniref:Yip1 family protein n=1 Tax=Carboxylicivirga sp. M1479 TaxID=2594476 RepID=UPI0011778975|nr:Yip1 family protein [Carboxylicivirga sp. M1479]TRX63013.1 DUF1282 domain-containing protein [Carboxylicivirga sp. M1479]